MSAPASRNTAAPAPRPRVQCKCGHVVFDGEVLLSRCVLIEAHGARAKCKCKEWVRVPLIYAG